VLLTHLLNVALLFRLVHRLSNSAHAASLAAALWGVCPVHAGTLGWYSVYGQVLATTFLLILLNHAAPVATENRRLPRSALITWPALLLAASTSFGIGIGITLVAPLVLYLILPRSSQRTRICLALAALALAMPLLYRGALALYDWAFGPTIEGLVAAIGLEHRALSWQQAKMMGLMFSYGLTSLVLGFFIQVGRFPETAAWITVPVFLALLSIVFVGSKASTRRTLLAFLALAGGCYFIIAQGRSHFFRGDLLIGASQLRYQYAASLPIAVLVGILAARCCRLLRLNSFVRWTLLIAWTALLIGSYRLAPPALEVSTNQERETRAVLSTVRSQVAAAPPGSAVYIENQPFRSVGPMLQDPRSGFPGWAGVYTIFFPTNVVDSRRVYFVVRDSATLEMGRKGRRTAGLLVSTSQSSTH
jgi:hypothetical protein